MDQTLPKLYKEYGEYSNYRNFPLDIDGLKPVERRVLLSAYKIARAKLVKSSGIEGQVSHRDLIIPGYVAILSGEIEEELAGWNIKVGPREAANIPKFLREA